ncbi:hypothetical protein ACHAP8_004505 [Fusarium lateritium]
MTTATQQQQHPPPQPHLGFIVDTYDPDDVVPRGSPLMTPLRPRLEPSPSPPPEIPATQVSLSASCIGGRGKSNRHKVRPNSGDAVLVAYLDNGRDPEIARAAGRESLPCDEESPDEEARDRPANGNLMSGPSLQHLAAGALEAASIVTAPSALAATRTLAATTWSSSASRRIQGGAALTVSSISTFHFWRDQRSGSRTFA